MSTPPSPSRSRAPDDHLHSQHHADPRVAPQVILGACRPALAYQALNVDPSIAAVLPCNVVVRALDDTTTLVEAFDPDAMMGLADNDALHAVAAEAKERLTVALSALDSTEGAS